MVQTVTITSLSHEQIHTPAGLIGKVIGLTNSLCMCAIPLGQAAFGPLIDHCPMTLVITGVGHGDTADMSDCQACHETGRRLANQASADHTGVGADRSDQGCPSACQA